MFSVNNQLMPEALQTRLYPRAHISKSLKKLDKKNSSEHLPGYFSLLTENFRSCTP